MADKATRQGTQTLGNYKKLGRKDIVEILKLAL